MEQIKQYTGRAYLYIEDGEVVANPRKPPNKNDHRNAMSKYHKKIKAWKSQHIKVENWYYGRTEQYKDMYTVGIGLNYYLVANGQPCHIENGIVTKLLT